MMDLRTQDIGGQWGHADVSESLSLTRSRDELLSSLAAIARKGEHHAMMEGYAEEVVRMLRHTDLEVQASALEALGSMGKASEGYAPRVSQYLTSESADVRAAAAGALGMLGSSQYASGLATCLEDGDEAVRVAAIGALGQIGVEEQAPPIALFLNDKSPVVVAAACQALGLLGTAGEAQVAAVGKRLSDPQTRYAAICAIANMSAGACEQFIGDIAEKCLTDRDSLTRQTAASALGDMRGAVLASKPAISKIVDLLNDQDPGIRCGAALTLGYMGEMASGHAEAVAALLKDTADDTSEMHLSIGGGAMRSPPASRRPKCAALIALGMMGASSLAQDCAVACSDENWEVRLCALECLANLGDGGRDQSSQIGTCLEDDIFVVRTKACETIGALKVEDQMHSLPELFDDKAPSVRAAALDALKEAPEVAQGYSSEVFKCLNDPIQGVQAAAIRCIGVMGEIGQSYASVIATMLYNEDPDIRASACEALGKLGNYGAAFADEVAGFLQDGEAQVRAAAARALGLMGSEGRLFEEDVRFLVNDPCEDVAQAAQSAMASMCGVNAE